MLVVDWATFHPRSTRSLGRTLEFQELAVAQFSSIHGVHGITAAFAADALGDAVLHSFSDVKGSTVSATGGFGVFRIGHVPLCCDLGPELFVGLIGVQGTVHVFIDGFLSILEIFVDALGGLGATLFYRFQDVQ